MKRQLQLHLQQRWQGQNSQFTFTASKTKAASERPQIHAFSYVFSAWTKFSVYTDIMKRQLQLHLQQRCHQQNSQFTFTALKTIAA